MNEIPKEQASLPLGMPAVTHAADSKQRQHTAAAMFLTAIQEDNRVVEDEILQSAVQPENKEK